VNVERLTTLHLVGRPVEAGDADDFARLFADERVHATLGGPRARADVDAMAVRWSHHWVDHGFGPYAWADRATGAFVGWCGLQWTTIAGERAVELLYAVDADRWGEGLATEASLAVLGAADGDLQIGELVAFTLTTNRASQRVMEKCGFVYDGLVEHKQLPHVLYRRTRADR
jgi:RimJ/RimL family protein N-acetyltransferase